MQQKEKTIQLIYRGKQEDFLFLMGRKAVTA